MRQVAEVLLLIVLGHQFVSRGDALYRVEVGTGMGQIHSGIVSDLAFWQLVERHLPLNNFESGVLCFLRFRDDVFVVTRGRQEADEFFNLFKAKASVSWIVERESVRSFGTPMLDAKIYKGPGFSKNGILYFAPFIKPTARHIPLCDSSSHPPSVHRGWPISEMARLRKRSLYSSSFALYQRLKTNRFARFFMHPGTLRKCREWRRPCILRPKPESRNCCV